MMSSTRALVVDTFAVAVRTILFAYTTLFRSFGLTGFGLTWMFCGIRSGEPTVCTVNGPAFTRSLPDAVTVCPAVPELTATKHTYYCPSRRPVRFTHSLADPHAASAAGATDAS